MWVHIGELRRETICSDTGIELHLEDLKSTRGDKQPLVKSIPYYGHNLVMRTVKLKKMPMTLRRLAEKWKEVNTTLCSVI